MLALRHADDQTVELLARRNLARQPRIELGLGGKAQHARLLRSGHRGPDPAWLDKTGTPIPGSQEASMLSFAAEGQFNSRLSCQIAMREELDGLIVRMPQGQH